MINESEVIDNVNKSQDLSLETRIAQHPWVDDPEEELKRIKKQQEEEANLYGDQFAQNKQNDKDELDGDKE